MLLNSVILATDGGISFYRTYMVVPPFVREYIIVHEPAYLIHPSHTKAFGPR